MLYIVTILLNDEVHSTPTECHGNYVYTFPHLLNQCTVNVFSLKIKLLSI